MKRLIPLLLLVAIAGAYIGYRRWLSTRPFEWAGTIEVRAVTVGSRVGGRVKSVLVAEGERVAASAPLVELEHGDLDAQRTIAAAQVDQAKAALDKLTKGARPEEIAQAQARQSQATAALDATRRGSRPEEIAAAAARVAQLQAGVDKAQLDADRARRLVASGAVPATELEAADTNLRAMTAQRDALAKVLDQLKAGARVEERQQAAARVAEASAAAQLVVSGARVEDLRAAQAQVQIAQGRVDQLDVAITELVIRAPATTSPAGLRVEALDLRPGDLVAPNAPVATLLEAGQLFVRIYVPETQIGRVKVGDELPITVDSFARSFKAKVEHINVRGEYSPRNLQTADERADQVFAVRVGLLEGADELRAGMAATARVDR